MIVSIDGLPGVGKTTLGLRLSEKYRIEHLAEVLLPDLAREDYREPDFIRNDIYKIDQARKLTHAILDRSFCSTISFKMALSGRFNADEFYRIEKEFYKGTNVRPDLMIFMMSSFETSQLGLKKRGDEGLFNEAFLRHWEKGLELTAQVMHAEGINVRQVHESHTPLYRSMLRERKPSQ